MAKIHSVCVYCGSSEGNDLAYVEAGAQLGEALAVAGLTLIYGGGTSGVMGALGRAALQAGGKVGAVIPGFLTSRESTTDALTMFSDLVITDTMHQRKHLMFERSDAFVALPGGIGTIEEIIEVMTWAQLGTHHKPLVFANVKGFWNPLLAMLEHVHAAGFLHSRERVRPLVVERVDAIIPALLAAAARAGSTQGDDAVLSKL